VRADLCSLRKDLTTPGKPLNLRKLGSVFRAHGSVFLAEGSQFRAQGCVWHADGTENLAEVFSIRRSRRVHRADAYLNRAHGR
jgi:hypothetical protein